FGIDRVCTTIEYPYFHTVDVVARQNSILHHGGESFLNGRNQLLGNGTTDDGIDKLKFDLSTLEFFGFQKLRVCWPEFKFHIGEKTRSTRLLFKFLTVRNGLGQCFLVAHLRCTPV